MRHLDRDRSWSQPIQRGKVSTFTTKNGLATLGANYREDLRQYSRCDGARAQPHCDEWQYQHDEFRTLTTPNSLKGVVCG